MKHEMTAKRERYNLESIMLDEERNGDIYSDRWFWAWKKYQNVCQHERHGTWTTASGKIVCVKCGKTLGHL